MHCPALPAPGTLVLFPAGQDFGALAPTRQYFPTGHVFGFVLPFGQYFPIGQSVLTLIIFVLGQYCPAGHSNGDAIDWLGQYLPFGQGVANTLRAGQ